MVAILKAEFRKLLTVRSTYFISFFAIALSIFLSFYLSGWRASPADVLSPSYLQNVMGTVISLLPSFGALVAILLIAHEYRYNTIMYTLTSSNSRSKVLIAKLITVTAYVLVLVGVGVVLSALAMYIGLNLKGITLADQVVYWKDLMWQGLYYAWANVAFGLLLGFLFRHVVGAMAVYFLLPTIEPLLAMLLRDNAKYLPMTALNSVTQPGDLSPGKAALVFGIYLAIGWIVAWILFVRRDAN